MGAKGPQQHEPGVIIAQAGDIIRVAMGRDPKTGEWLCDKDPLAWWCGVERIMRLVRPSSFIGARS